MPTPKLSTGEEPALARRRRQARQKRRALVLERLVAAVGVSLILGLIPGFHFMLLFALLAAVATGAYVVSLIKIRDAARTAADEGVSGDDDHTDGKVTYLRLHPTEGADDDATLAQSAEG